MNKDEQNLSYTEQLTRSLQNTMKAELEQLPKLLEDLEPKQRINVLCKLMPYVIPKQRIEEEQTSFIGFDFP